jgi:D-glycero-D-manno-heptose 1,7-bisphosphate phosphatase
MAGAAEIDASVGPDGVWRQVLRRGVHRSPSPALFLDRDGTIVAEVGHLSRAEDVRLVKGAAALIAAANRADVPVVVVSNQSGIGRGLFDWDDFVCVQRRMIELLAAERAEIHAVFACPHHADAEPPWRHPDHPARKPNPTMLHDAARLLPIALDRSWIVGDRASDLAAGRNAGLRGGLLVLSPTIDQPGELRGAQVLAGRTFRVFVTPSLVDVLQVAPLLGDEASAGDGSFEPGQTRP